MSKETTIWGAIGATVVPVFEFMYGAGEMVIPLMVALGFFLGLDWLSGTRASEKDDSYSSRYGIDGLFRSFFILLLPAGGNFLDKAFNLPGILFGLFAAALLYHVIKSMVANAMRAGWGDDLPVWLFERLLNWVKSEIESKVDRAINRGGKPARNEGDSHEQV